MATLGPANGTLTVRTGRSGAAAKAGHDLVLEVTAWEATFDEAAIVLTADARSLKVREGTGGIKALDDDDKANIEQTIDDDVLKGGPIEFRSTGVARDGERVSVRGELTIGRRSNPIAFDLLHTDGRLAGSATLKQTDYGIKPYSALFGTLKVADEVTVSIDADTGRLRDG
jgi:polyisoprenoid-binding protein YceI